MKIIKTLILLLFAVVITSCNKDEDPQNNAPVSQDIEISMEENPTSDLVTTIIATDLDEDELTYTIQSQTPTGSIQINETTGEIFILNINAFDYELNTIITASIIVSDGIDDTNMQLTINILDVNETG